MWDPKVCPIKLHFEKVWRGTKTTPFWVRDRVLVHHLETADPKPSFIYCLAEKAKLLCRPTKSVTLLSVLHIPNRRKHQIKDPLVTPESKQWVVEAEPDTIATLPSSLPKAVSSKSVSPQITLFRIKLQLNRLSFSYLYLLSLICNFRGFNGFFNSNDQNMLSRLWNRPE